MIPTHRRPTHPGILLSEDYLKPRKISITAFADATGYSRKQISKVVNGNARIEAPMAVRIARVLATTPQFWLNLQSALDLYDAQQANADWQPKATFAA